MKWNYFAYFFIWISYCYIELRDILGLCSIENTFGEWTHRFHLLVKGVNISPAIVSPAPVSPTTEPLSTPMLVSCFFFSITSATVSNLFRISHLSSFHSTIALANCVNACLRTSWQFFSCSFSRASFCCFSLKCSSISSILFFVRSTSSTGSLTWVIILQVGYG